MVDNLFDYVFDFIYTEAMEDATRRTAAYGLKDEILELDSVKTIVRRYAQSVIDGKSPVFDEIEATVENAIKLEKDGRQLSESFTFGNIQKLINMTMKYLYIRYFDTDKGENFYCCDTPLDSRMRDQVRKAYRAMYPDKKIGLSSECAWSKITRDKTDIKYRKDNYDWFQRAVRELVDAEKDMVGSSVRCPLDYDYKYYK